MAKSPPRFNLSWGDSLISLGVSWRRSGRSDDRGPPSVGGGVMMIEVVSSSIRCNPSSSVLARWCLAYRSVTPSRNRLHSSTGSLMSSDISRSSTGSSVYLVDCSPSNFAGSASRIKNFLVLFLLIFLRHFILPLWDIPLRNLLDRYDANHSLFCM